MDRLHTKTLLVESGITLLKLQDLIHICDGNYTVLANKQVAISITKPSFRMNDQNKKIKVGIHMIQDIG